MMAGSGGQAVAYPLKTPVRVMGCEHGHSSLEDPMEGRERISQGSLAKDIGGRM